ncbi:MAG: antitoxin [Asticcacaulis sp.]|nr:antitoxin [Asticcacaulis sp.]
MTQAPKSHPSEDQSECLSAVKAGLRSLEAGQSVPYEKVRRWLLSWGTPSELSKPECV